MSIQEEQQLLFGLNNNDEKAFSKVYRLFYEGMLYVAKGILLSKEDAEDIVCDAFQKLWEKEISFVSLKKVKCYVFVMVKHACFHANEKFKSRKIRTKGIPEETISYNDGYSRLLYYSDKIIISALLDSIPERESSIIHLWYGHNKRAAEIATLLNTTPDNVRVCKQRTLRQMKEKLKSHI